MQLQLLICSGVQNGVSPLPLFSLPLTLWGELPGESPWKEDPGGLQSMESQTRMRLSD